MKAIHPPKGNAIGRKHYKLAMLASLLAKAAKAGLAISIAIYKDNAWYSCNGEYICPVLCSFDNYAYACKILRPQIKAEKHKATLLLIESIEKADLLGALKTLGYNIQ